MNTLIFPRKFYWILPWGSWILGSKVVHFTYSPEKSYSWKNIIAFSGGAWVYTLKFDINLLLSSEDMIWRMSKLNILSVDYVVVHDSIFPAANKAFKGFLFYFIVIIHISTACCTTWDFIDWFLYGVHLIRNRWQDDTQWHFESIVCACIAWKMSVWISVGTWIVLWVILIFEELLLVLGVLLRHFWLVRYKLGYLWSLLLRERSLWLYLGLLPSLL